MGEAFLVLLPFIVCFNINHDPTQQPFKFTKYSRGNYGKPRTMSNYLANLPG